MTKQVGDLQRQINEEQQNYRIFLEERENSIRTLTEELEQLSVELQGLTDTKEVHLLFIEVIYTHVHVRSFFKVNVFAVR